MVSNDWLDRSEPSIVCDCRFYNNQVCDLCQGIGQKVGGRDVRNPKFNALLTKMAETHDRKNADYATDNNPYSNFEIAASIAGCDVATVFRVLMGVKLARLQELLKGKTPNNESIEDSKLDLAVYAALWASY